MTKTCVNIVAELSGDFVLECLWLNEKPVIAVFVNISCINEKQSHSYKEELVGLEDLVYDYYFYFYIVANTRCI